MVAFPCTTVHRYTGKDHGGNKTSPEIRPLINQNLYIVLEFATCQNYHHFGPGFHCMCLVYISFTRILLSKVKYQCIGIRRGSQSLT